MALRRAEYQFEPEHADLLAPQLDMGAAEVTNVLRGDPRKFICFPRGSASTRQTRYGVCAFPVSTFIATKIAIIRTVRWPRT